ncbi:MAG: helix-turn-helix domain-containing protein [Gammaproteobacteria bacterium]|nr:helix-turn-helix domain-containing protein [Gammaproteobacteria bacterium]
MTSRTNGQAEGLNRADRVEKMGVDLETRRQEAIKRYLDGEPIEQICREMKCSKSWLYKWKKRYRATESGWAVARSRRPVTTPSKTSEAVEKHIVRLAQTLVPPETRTLSARMIRDALAQHGEISRPSLRTISRILNRHRKEVNSLSIES